MNKYEVWDKVKIDVNGMPYLGTVISYVNRDSKNLFDVRDLAPNPVSRSYVTSTSNGRIEGSTLITAQAYSGDLRYWVGGKSPNFTTLWHFKENDIVKLSCKCWLQQKTNLTNKNVRIGFRNWTTGVDKYSTKTLKDFGTSDADAEILTYQFTNDTEGDFNLLLQPQGNSGAATNLNCRFFNVEVKVVETVYKVSVEGIGMLTDVSEESLEKII